MARCFVLEGFSVEDAGPACLVKLEGWDLEPVEWFARIVCSAFPSSGLSRAGEPSDSGFLGLRKTLALRGRPPVGGLEQLRRFLSLLTETLTIEDSLDESHSLGYHQDEDETGGLARSELGWLVIRASAKYGRPPEADARGRITEALRRFIEGHPRYCRAKAIAAVPPREAGGQGSLSQSVGAELAAQLGLTWIEIIRVSSRPPQKDIVDEDRKKGVERRIANQEDSMGVDDDVAGLSVVVMDDLYGSGASMREAARVLRDSGAKEVLGLTVTKQRLYEGVRLATLD
jgi:hypothetical protein